MIKSIFFHIKVNLLSSVFKEVLYVGDNLILAETLLSIASADFAFNIHHEMCVNGLEKTLNENKFTHFICELSLPDAIQKRINEKYPDLSCSYLFKPNLETEVNTEATFNDDQKTNLPFITPDFVSVEVKAILDSISLPIYVKNIDDEIIDCNSDFSQRFNLLPEDFIGKNTESIFPLEFAKTLKKSELNLRIVEDVDLFECQMPDFTGEHREFVIREQKIEGSNLHIGMLFDVSEMNQTKRTLDKERIMLRATANISSDLICFKDLESRFIGCNKQFEMFVGCPEADIIGKKDDQLFEMSQALMCQAQDAQVMESGEAFADNEYLTYNNGDIHYIFMQKVPLKDSQGNVIGVIAIGRDITEKSMIKKQLKVANVVFENSRDAIFVTDGAGIVISSNDACVGMSGYSKSDFLNKSIKEFTKGSDYRRLFINIEKSLKEHGQWQGNTTFFTKNGEQGYFWLEVYEVNHRAIGIKNRVYAFTDLTQNKYNEEKIHYLSKHDSLTGLNNRIALFNHLENAIARSVHKQIPMGVLFVEIKGFKAIHDLYGHNRGDLVIKDVAKRLKQSIFSKDIIARIGDDQFVLVVEELDNEQVVALIAQRIAQQFMDSIIIDGMSVNLFPSIGISVCPDDGMDLDTILANAESAMHRSQEDKSSSYHFFTNELTLHSTHQLGLENELRLALEANQFEIYYQPQFDLNKRQVVALECSPRWNHSSQGLLLPDRFLMLAEQSGLLINLGIKIFEKAAKQAVSWHNTGVNFGRMAFDLSKLELSQISLIGNIQQVLLATGAKANWFEFAVEDSLFSSDLDTIQDNLLNLSKMGCSLTVDGFGAERSVLYSIGKLNIDKFKISKHFIQGVPGYLAGEAMIKSVFILAESLGVDVVGEGIAKTLQEKTVSGHSTAGGQASLQKAPMKASEATFYLRCHKRK